MSDPFVLHQSAGAKSLLKSFSEDTRRKGEEYLSEQRVTELECEKPGTAYRATVRGKFPYTVELFHGDEAGWEVLCSCPVQFDCKHAYAALKSLLAENSLAAVRSFSGAARNRPTAKPSPVLVSLSVQVRQALGRELQREEAKFLQRLHTLFVRCRAARLITHWDLQSLGLGVKQRSWGPAVIWPAFPATEKEFWLYVANAVREMGGRIPAFLEAVSDVNPIRDRLRRWRRGQDVARWKNSLETFGRFPQIRPAQSSGVADLRLRIKAEAAVLEWKKPADGDFEPVPVTRFRELASERRSLTGLPSDAALIWELMRDQLRLRGTHQLRYEDTESLVLLNRLLRLEALASRVVSEDGQPLRRAAEPLRWEISPTADEFGDYRLLLVKADGVPAPTFLCVLDGLPVLYVSPDTVFTGPPPCPDVLPSPTENLVPAPALESQSGAQFLHALGVTLPPRMAERVRRVPFDVGIRCELRQIYPGSRTEDCLVQLRAASTDGHVDEVWTGQGWQSVKGAASPEKKGKVGKDNGDIVIYDRASLVDAPGLLAPLALKWNGFSRAPALRVTKKFPELFAAWLRSLPAGFPVQLAGDLASLAGAAGAVSGSVRLEVTETTIDWFDLRVVLDVTDTTLTPQELKVLLNAKGGYVRLEGKGWRRLQFDLTEEEDGRLARLGLNARELSAEPQRLHALQLADEAAKKLLPEAQAAQIERRVSELKTRVTPDLPASVHAELRPYQLEGFHFLAYLAANRFGGILADDMGLGKTLQALAWLLWLREQIPIAPATSAHPSLVVCPKSVTDNWRAEVERFTPGLRVKVWSAGELPQLPDRRAEADLHVLNYSQLRIVGESLAPVRWLAVILDEGQYIKNPNSQTAQVARALRAEHRLVLTGTPIENRLLDLWSLMAFAMPGVLGSRAQFGRLYDARGDPFARCRLSARVRPFLLRRTKSQVAKDLPDRIEEDLFCTMEGDQRTLYRAELKRAQQWLLSVRTQKQLAREQFNFLTSLLRLRQICCHPALAKTGSTAASAKSEALLEQLEPLMEEGNKVLVFSQFVELLDLLKPAIAERGWPIFMLTGDTENRGDLVRAFQSAEGAAVFLISLKAGGFGLNLTAASYVVLFDPWWNPAVENQAIDRTHRIGQTNKVIAYRLLIKDSIEEKIRALQKQKSALAGDVLGEEKFAQSLTLDDLRYLLAD